jgi:hypothetical protein
MSEKGTLPNPSWELAEAGQEFYRSGWVLGTSGNFSMLLARKPLRICVTASGLDKGKLDETNFLELLNWASYVLYGAPYFEFSNNSKNLLSRGSGRDGHDSRSSDLRSAHAGKDVEVKKPRVRRSIAAALMLAATGLFGYALSPWQGARNYSASPALPIVNAGFVANSPSQVPVRLSMQLIGQRKDDEDWSDVVVSEGASLRSGDQFQVRIKSDHSAYLYLILYDSRGQASQLFPDTKIEHPGFVTAHSEIAVPDKHLWFWLDNHPGTETIYALASQAPLTNISELLAKLENVHAGLNKPGPGQLREPIKSVQRGVGGFTQSKEATLPVADLNVIKQVTAVVVGFVGSGVAVRSVSFRHE